MTLGGSLALSLSRSDTSRVVHSRSALLSRRRGHKKTFVSRQTSALGLLSDMKGFPRRSALRHERL